MANMEELIDTLKALLYLSPVRGNRVALAGGSGGQSVAITDAFVEAGLEVPRLTRESYDELASFWTLIGGGYGNPIDTGNENRKEMRRIIEILERDANIDNLVLSINLRLGNPEQLESHINSVIDIRKRTTKPAMAVLSYSFLPLHTRLYRRSLFYFSKKLFLNHFFDFI